MKLATLMAAAMASGLLMAAPVMAQTTAAPKQQTEGEGPSDGGFNSPNGPQKQKTQSLSHAEAPAMKQRTQSMSHADGSFAEGVTKQR